jgi:hypothetical protein
VGTSEPPVCPECGGRMQLVTDGLVGRWMAPPFFIVGRSRLRLDLVARPFGACTECEFCIEVPRLKRT